MFIDKYKKDDGYYDENGCFYEDAEEFIQCHILNSCGCGSPDRNTRYVYNVLKRIENCKTEDTDTEYFALYVFDKLWLTEHGGSIGGSWLSEKGKQLLSDMRELYG
jgi:hypothetical protein